jgi:hypothetical protein
VVPLLPSDPIDPGDHSAPTPAPAAIQNANRHKSHTFCDAVDRAAGGARHVGTVPIAVFGPPTVVDGGASGERPPRELLVRGADPRVDDVRPYPRTGKAVGVGTPQGERPLIDAVNSPGGIVLRGGVDRSHHPILFDEQDVGVSAEALKGTRRQRGRKALEGGLVNEVK